MKDTIKGFGGLLVATTLGGAAIGAAGLAGMGAGITSATQTFIGLGVMSKAASLFKWK